MSEGSRVRVEANGPILEITFDHPPAHAFNQQASRDLDAALTRLNTDPALRVAIVTATGERMFSAGWDLKAVAAGENGEDFGPHGFMGLNRHDLQKPVIVAVNGLAVGGGFEFALNATLVIAAPHVEFGLPELQRGFIPEAGGLWRAHRRLPVNIASELLLTGRRLSAEEGRQYGFVNRIVPSDQLLTVAREMAGQIITAAPLAVAALLEVTREVEVLSDRAAFERIYSGLPARDRMRASEDFHEGPRAFAEKRAPRWTGK
ncbi:enoyl-CoA hydratase-related protein [Mesorhizobium sp. DCY119]|jgi:crotonobetainyl-CoA hydratase|uniref:enoyl-CoA hydratase-related protein n=1 Tax=Mesorhizobium sp. DCY119 TaxID=2108445 RepID=UPI000E764B9B|nr:enoyl-CoA hydratase-related protein [Mesorhizobium sp. DCY119]RJG41035.1 carnitinyl-CoA dehydratase [Mesorhizobium sp. DCY119]